MTKTFGVSLSSRFAGEYVELQKRAEKGDGEAQYLLKIVDKGIAKLAQDPRAGKKIQKRIWPKEYVREYGIDNLWKLNLDSFWRMTYTVTGQKTEIISLFLEVLDHKKYDRRFGYKTS
ncbi:MAG: hypothetical protein ABH950_01650 [Candidatus Altiarchaeota archaeon]